MKYISILSYAFAFLFLYSQLSMAKDVASDDSLYTREYISQIYIAEPERALKLLDEAEIGEPCCHTLLAICVAWLIVICI